MSFSILDPETPQLLTYLVGPGQSIWIPQGWWHWITCVSDEAHDHVIFNNASPQSVEGSDVLRLTPPQVFELAYNVDAKRLARKRSTAVGRPPVATRTGARAAGVATTAPRTGTGTLRRTRLRVRYPSACSAASSASSRPAARPATVGGAARSGAIPFPIKSIPG